MTDYRKLPLHAKQRHALDAIRPGPVRCPHCTTQVMERYLSTHTALFCPGSREARDAALLSSRRFTA